MRKKGTTFQRLLIVDGRGVADIPRESLANIEKIVIEIKRMETDFFWYSGSHAVARNKTVLYLLYIIIILLLHYS
jgi:hypothetical protein